MKTPHIQPWIAYLLLLRTHHNKSSLLALDERILFGRRKWVGIVPTVTHGAAIASLVGING